MKLTIQSHQKFWKKDFYVDDVLHGADTVDEAVRCYTELKAVMRSACLNLPKWTSNSNELMAHIPQDQQELHKNNGIIKVLGVFWAPEADVLAYNFSISMDTIPKKK